LCTVGATARAHEAESYFNASREFEAIVGRTSQSGNMPRIEDKEVAKLIAVLSDTERFLKSSNYSVKELDSLMGICGKSTSAMLSYVYFGLKSKVDSNTDPKTIPLLLAQLTEKNMVTFQNELEHLEPFSYRCMAKEIPLLSEFILALPPEKVDGTRRAGLQNFRNGIFSIFIDSLRTSHNPAYSKSYREKILRALADTATLFSSVLQPKVRHQISEYATLTKTVAPTDFDSYFESIILAMADESCDGLCKI
jgi:hypothetical protein